MLVVHSFVPFRSDSQWNSSFFFFAFLFSLGLPQHVTITFALAPPIDSQWNFSFLLVSSLFNSTCHRNRLFRFSFTRNQISAFSFLRAFRISTITLLFFRFVTEFKLFDLLPFRALLHSFSSTYFISGNPIFLTFCDSFTLYIHSTIA